MSKIEWTEKTLNLWTGCREISPGCRHCYARAMAAYCATREIPVNTWLGVTVENQRHGLPRLEFLREVGAAVRFISAEPLLEDLGRLDLSGIHWVIAGGESGPRARPMHPSWVRAIRDQCAEQGVPFFFKQWGTWSPDGIKRSKKANSRLLDGLLHHARPTP